MVFLLNNQNVHAHFTIIKLMRYLDYSSGEIKKCFNREVFISSVGRLNLEGK